MSDVYRAQVALYLELEDLGNFEVVEFHGSWMINGIPSASCVLAVGREAVSGSRLAQIHKQGGKLTSMHKAKVYAKIVGAWNGKKSWPEAPQLIFEGRLTGVGFKKNSGNVQFVAHIIHWISDMSYASTLSEQSHPTNPVEYSYAANFPDQLLRAQGKSKPMLVAQLMGATVINTGNIMADLWGKALQPFLCGLIQKDTIEHKGRGLAGVANAQGTNANAIAALKRIQGAGGDCGTALGKYAVPLAFSYEGLGNLGGTVSNAIRTAVGRMSLEAYATTTLWDVISGQLAPQFMFSVIPLVDTAIVAPLTPGLRSTYSSTIAANDFEAIDLSGYIPRTLRGVGIFGNIQFRTGARTTLGPKVPTGIGGIYEAKGVEDGMFMFKACPSWLGNIMPFVAKASKTTGVKNTVPIHTATAPDENPGEAAQGDENGKVQDEQAEPASILFDRFAHAVYVNEALRGRTGMISGKLRFDIAPGSTVRIQGTQEQFIGSQDALAQNLVGTVSRVSVSISAQSGTAGTGFQIAHLRTEAENSKDNTSVENHPLYETIYKGAPLVDAYRL